MKLSVVDDIGLAVGEMWQRCQRGRERFRFALPLSSTPMPIYEWVIARHNEFDWANTEFVLMDEQVEGSEPPFHYVDVGDEASYEGFARRHFLDPLRSATQVGVPVLKPSLSDIDSFETDIDLLVLAIGPSGNYANVMPGTPLHVGWHVTALSDEFRSVHTAAASESYAGVEFRTHGMSLGPQQVLAASSVVVVARGPAKRELAERLLALDAFDPKFPISVIHHPELRDRVEIVLATDVGIQP